MIVTEGLVNFQMDAREFDRFCFFLFSAHRSSLLWVKLKGKETNQVRKEEESVASQSSDLFDVF
jgi:hypothetical protein